MKKRMILIAVIVLSFVTSALASEKPLMKEAEEALETFTQGCQSELSTFCKDVTPGEGRVLACLYAFEDKITPRCEYALYDSMGQLNRTLTNLSYAINECSDDLDTYCADIKPGEGRLFDCLKRNKDKVNKRCITALKDIGWMN